jgi:PfaD family protein
MKAHGVKAAYMAGAMANGIASEELVIALGSAGYLASFGAAGLVPARVEQAIQRIQKALPDGPYAFNLIHSPSEEALERGAVELYLKYGVKTVEASAFLDLTEHIVRYRVAGLKRNSDGSIQIGNRVIAKISRREVASKFMRPAPMKFLEKLLQAGHISKDQMEMAQTVPMSDDIIVEADSGGHTDNRPLPCLLPSILGLRDEIQAEFLYSPALRVGAGGGISTPLSALGAYMMGAAFIVTGSVNQACVESGSCDHVRKVLAQAEMADVAMAPAADMFEMGVKLQVLKRGTLFPMRAQKLYEIYRTYSGLETIPQEEKTRLETQIFRRSLDQIWSDTRAYFLSRDPEQVHMAEADPKQKMALVFRWYLGLSSRWANSGEKGREMDYQIWAGPAMGAFNDWVRNTYLSEPAARNASVVADEILSGAAYFLRVRQAEAQGIRFDSRLLDYRPSR